MIGISGGYSPIGHLAYSREGLGQVDTSTGFDIGTFLGTSGAWLLFGGGALLYWMMFGQASARERSSRLSAAKKRYQSEVRGIKSGYTRTRKRKAASSGVMSRYKECDIGPSGKVWYKGAWRKPENVEEC